MPVSAPPIRVLLIDDHDLIRAGLRLLLEQHPHLIVVGEGASGEEALRLSRELAPDVVVMNLSMPGMTSVEAMAVLTDECPASRVIVLSAQGTAKFVRRAIRAGARGYVLTSERVMNLTAAVHAVHAGGTWFSPALHGVMASLVSDPHSMETDPLERLSLRQRSVLRLIAEGQTNRGIAGTLGISESTVDTHRTELMRRLDLHDVAAVVRFACQEGLVGVQ